MKPKQLTFEKEAPSKSRSRKRYISTPISFRLGDTPSAPAKKPRTGLSRCRSVPKNLNFEGMI